MTHTITIRSKWALIGTGVIAALAVILEALMFIQEGGHSALISLPFPLGVVLLCAWLWAWPSLTLAPGGVFVRNHFRDISIPWDQITDTRTRYGLRIVTGDREFVCAAPPERGGFAANRKNAVPAAPIIDDTRTVHHRVQTVPAIAARLVLEQRDLALHPEHAPRVSSRDRGQIQKNLAESPIPAKWDASFPAETTVRWQPWPALAVAICVAALAAEMVV